MFRRIALALLLVTSLFSPVVASADEAFPEAPQTAWWDKRPLPNVRYGQWLPCRTEWKITDDCVKEINIFKEDGTAAGSLTYRVFPEFNPATAKQIWKVVPDLNGAPYENSAYFENAPAPYAQYILPTGITNSDGGSYVNAYVHMMQGGIQVNITADDAEKNSLPKGYYFETVIQSTNLGKGIKWILSNVRDPQVKIDGNLVTVKGLPDKSPSARAGDPVCEPNELKAFTSQLNMAVNLVTYDAGRKTTDTNPGDVVLGTNGWWCLSDFRFDKESQQIVVKVGNVHYDEFGNEIQGWMELKIKGERARTWWGMDPSIAAGYAKVEITYQNGTSKIATVVSQYDKKNDWINLRAYGFTYSTPQLAVSFVKPKEEAAPITTPEAPVVIAPPAQKVQTKKTITCVKGKATKKVTGTNPKCPSGYKKK